ncbi:MAG: hypothetical protein QME60_05000, partial [Verrucomicrobiota bacterium]|nr:hypothetical protein [Verrucomicrobiota bacterium]
MPRPIRRRDFGINERFLPGDETRGFMERTNAAYRVECLEVLPAQTGGVFERRLYSRAFEEGCQEPRDRRVSRAGRAGNAGDMKGRAPQFPMRPVLRIARPGRAHGREFLFAAGLNIPAAAPRLDGGHFRAKPKQPVGQRRVVASPQMVDKVVATMLFFHGKKPFRLQHVQRFLHGRQEDINAGKDAGENFAPGRPARLGPRIGQRHVAGCRGAGFLGDAKNLSQFFAVVRIHAAHKRGIAEMEVPAVRDKGRIEIVSAVRVVGAGIMQEDPVNPGRRHHDRIGTVSVTTQVPARSGRAPEGIGP